MSIFTVTILSLATAADPSGAISAATGGGGVAIVESSESGITNSATLPFLNGYFFGSSIRSRSIKAINGSESSWRLNVTDALDDSAFPAALDYQQSSYINNDRRFGSNKDFHLGTALQTTRKTALGIGFQYRQSNLEDGSGTRINQINWETGFIWAPTSQLAFGVIGQNLSPNNQSLDNIIRLQRTMSLGASYSKRQFYRLRTEIESGDNYNFGNSNWSLGVENFINQWTILRAGNNYDFNTAENIHSVGIGFAGPKFGIHYAYAFGTRATDISEHTIDMSIPFN